jgi:hypothetical protein
LLGAGGMGRPRRRSREPYELGLPFFHSPETAERAGSRRGALLGQGSVRKTPFMFFERFESGRESTGMDRRART